MPSSPKLQLERFLQALEIRQFEGPEQAMLEPCLAWLRAFPHELDMQDRQQALKAVREAFNLTEDQLNVKLYGAEASHNTYHSTPGNPDDDRKLAGLLRPGFIKRYTDYTECCESPLAYHVFSALAGIGAVVNRRSWLDMGVFKIYPATGVIILGPSGLKKTTAADIIADIITELGTVKMYCEKLTPEALIEAMIGDATGMVYAPELTVFLNKQRYNDGLVNLLTRFMDCPSKWASGTIMRKERHLENVGISLLMCSTLEYFIPDVPPEAIKGGFLPRNLIVLQEECARVVPRPIPLDPNEKTHLVEQLALIHAHAQGEFKFSKEADQLHEEWYRTTYQDEKKLLEHEMMGAVLNRKDGHILRTALALHISDCNDLILCAECYDRALQLVNWLEQYLPYLFRKMFKSQGGEEQDAVLHILRKYGDIKHWELVKKLAYKLDAERVRKIIQFLREQRLVVEYNDALQGHGYKLVKD